MAKKKGQRNLLLLLCSECESRHYITEKNKLNTPDKLEYSKYCPECRKHTLHKEKTKLK